MNQISLINKDDLDEVTEPVDLYSFSNESESHTSSDTSTHKGRGYKPTSLLILNKYKKFLLFNVLSAYFSIVFIVLLFLSYNIYRYLGVL